MLNKLYFEEAIENGDTEKVKSLINYVDPNPYKGVLLFSSLKKGNLDIAKLIIEDERTDPSVSNSNAIQIACNLGYTSIVELLLKDERIDPTYNDNCITFASNKGYYDIIKLLINDKRMIANNYNYYNEINNAAKKGYTDIFKLLIDNNLDTVDFEIFISALKNKNTDIALHIINLNLVDLSEDYDLVLFYSKKYNINEITSILIENKNSTN